VDECVREGNRELARFLDCSVKTACRYAKLMRQSSGVIYKWRKAYKGKDGKTRFTTVNRWWPSRVQAWMAWNQRQKDQSKIDERSLD
jgi:hypothetical protein